MLYKDDYQREHPDIHEGMTAYSSDGEKLGKVVDLAPDSLTVEKGLFFPKDFTFRYDDIVDEREDSVILAKGGSDLSGWRDENYVGWQEYDQRNERPEADRTSEENTEYTLHREELETEKKRRKKGEVEVRKVVHTEIRELEVPVTHEEIVIERKPAKGVDPENADFREEEIIIPLTEEEVEVKKRTVAKEQVDVHKESHTEQRKVSGEVRDEEIEIEEEGDVEHGTP